MILYHLGHYGLLSRCITHKVCFHKEENAFFLMDEKLSSPKTKEYFHGIKDRFSCLGIDVILYNDSMFLEEASEENMLSCIISFFDDALLGINPDKIYTGFDTFDAFGVYLNYKGKKYSLIEVSSGQYEIDRYDANNNEIYDSLLKKYKTLSSNNENVLGVLRLKNMMNATEGKDYYVDYYHLEEEFSEDIRKKILYCFNMEGFDNISGDYNLLVCSSFWIIHYLKKYVRFYFDSYHKLMDFFSDELKLIIKPHPSAFFEEKNWDNAHNGTHFIHPGFPSGYLHLFKKMKIKEVFGTDSSGIENLFPRAKLCNIPLIPFFRNSEIMDMMFSAVQIYNASCFDSRLYFTGSDKTLLEILFSRLMGRELEFSGFNKTMLYGNSFFFIDELSENEKRELVEVGLEGCHEEATLFFCNKDKTIMDMFLRNPKQYVNLIPIEIRHIYKSEETRKTVFVYTKSIKKLREIRKLIFTKTLYCSGEALVIKAINGDFNYIDNGNNELVAKLTKDVDNITMELEKKDKLIKDFNSNISLLENDLKDARYKISELEQDVEDRTNYIYKLESKYDESNLLVDKLKKELDESYSMIDDRDFLIENISSEKNMMLRSKSWRYTSFFRKVYYMLFGEKNSKQSLQNGDQL